MVTRGVGARARARACERATTRTRTANVKNKDEGKPAHHHCHCRRRQYYHPHCCLGACYGLRMGPIGPRRQKADLEMASPFLPLLGMWSGMGDAWRARAPSSAGVVAYACVARIGSQVPR